MRALDN